MVEKKQRFSQIPEVPESRALNRRDGSVGPDLISWTGPAGSLALHGGPLLGQQASSGLSKSSGTAGSPRSGWGPLSAWLQAAGSPPSTETGTDSAEEHTYNKSDNLTQPKTT